MTPEILIVIPVYNNPETIAAVVQSCLDKSKLPVLVIDDSSTEPVSVILQKSQITHARLHLIRFPLNRGKGAALKAAFRYAIEHGFTHCLTLDGDGQHLASEIIHLEKAAWQNPWNIIIGKRVLSGEHVPDITKFGRRFSNFWVWYETGHKVEDSQSGMRVYPLFHLQNTNFLTDRYDFEIESLTRATWNGAGITEVPIAVHYPEASQRVSHFKKFHDNVRISILNIRLVTASLFRRHLSPTKAVAALAIGAATGILTEHALIGFAVLVPFAVILQLNGWLLLGSMMIFAAAKTFHWFAGLAAISGTQETLVLALLATILSAMTWHASTILERKAKTPWTAKMRGGKFGAFFLQQVSSKLGLAATYACLFFIAPYFYFFAPRGKRASLEYLKQAFPDDHPITRHFKVVRHFYKFGQILLDRLFQSHQKTEQGSAFKLNIIGKQHITGALDSGKGALLLSAHVGGWDISTRAMLLECMREKFAVAEFTPKGELSSDDTIRKGDPAPPQKITDHAGQIPILHYRNMLDAGRIIAIMGDRPLTDKFALVRFFGKLAPFDVTPFRIAASCNAPIIFCFAFKNGFKSYELILDPPRCYKFTRGDDRDALSRAWVQEFATRLESELRRHPYQWLNFFPFFSTPPKRIVPANIG